MARSYSQDLRERIVSCIHSGSSRRAAAARFGVSPSTAVRLQARFESTGSVATARQDRPPGGGKLGPHRDFLIEQVDPSSLSRFLCKQGFSYKQNTAGIGTRTR